MAPAGKLWETRDGMAGFQGLAEILTEKYHVDPPLDRRRIRDWWNRGTKNSVGKPFPQPVETTRKDPDSGRAYRWFDIAAVEEWFCQGIPGPFGSGWRFPDSKSILPADWPADYPQA